MKANGRRNIGYCVSFLVVPSMALILLVHVQSRVFTTKCSEPQVGISNQYEEYIFRKRMGSNTR